jgi:protein-S-isoprenylcysteine O-methyltransferase Ste14
MSGSRIPPLGPRGEGWLGLQVLLMVAIPVEAWRESMTGDAADVPTIVRVLGGVALLAGLALIAWSSVLLRRSAAFSALPRPLEAGSLVVSGPYGYVRHPIYSGLVLSAAGIAAIRASLPLVLLTVAIAVVLDVKRRREELWLAERYPGYDAYRRRTKALLPLVY